MMLNHVEVLLLRPTNWR